MHGGFLLIFRNDMKIRYSNCLPFYMKKKGCVYGKKNEKIEPGETHLHR